MLDRNQSGAIDLADISKRVKNLHILVGVYDVSMNPEFIEGRKSKE